MKKISVLIFCSFVLCSLLSCQRNSNDIAEKPSITVTNTSTVSLAADTVEFDLSIRQRGRDVDDITDQGNIKANRAKEILKKFGIDEVPTSQFRVSPFYSYTIIDENKSFYDSDNEKKQYEYHEYLHTLSVKIQNINSKPQKIGEVMDALFEIQGLEVGNLRYSISDNRKANAAVRKSSAQAVMKKIESYAAGCGAKVKNIRRMSEGYYTRDTGIEMARPAATRNTYAMAKQAVSFDAVEDKGIDDSSTQITSDKMNFTAQVDYTSYLSGKKDSMLSVSGYSQVKAAPDIAHISLNIKYSGEDTAEMSKNAATVLKDICSNLIRECDITTVSFYISPYFESDSALRPLSKSSSLYHSDRANVIKYYELTHSLRISVRDYDADNKLGRVIDSIKKYGGEAISIMGIDYTMSDNTTFTAKAREGASANAKEKCDIYASGAGTKCTGTFSITERYSTQDSEIDGDELYYGPELKKKITADDIAQSQTLIFPGRVSVVAELTVTADI